MPNRRLPIPKKIKDKLLVDCRHRCIMCHQPFTKIHHGDGNRSNNNEDNLFPLFSVMPILFSFLFLMVSDAYDVSMNFVFVSVVILMSALGIAGLIKTVLDSTS